MVFRVKVVRRAEVQIEEAAAWWGKNRPSAPDAIREDLQVAFELIARHPNVGALALNAKLQGLRRLHLSRVRYHLYYRIQIESRTVQVPAFWHTSRGVGPNL